MQKATVTRGLPAIRKTIFNFILSRRNIIAEIISALFIILFLYTALNKTTDIHRTAEVLRTTKVLPAYANIIAWGVVVAEYLVALLLFLPKTKKTGLYASLGLLSVFTIYITWMMIFAPDLPCTCGGVIATMTWKQHLIFNTIFISLSVIGIKLYDKRLKQH